MPTTTDIDYLTPLIRSMRNVFGIPGDFAEFGVLYGESFVRVCREAETEGRTAHAIDSFEGMGTPSERDRSPDGIQYYPKGRFNTDGPEQLMGRLERECPGCDWRIWRGFVPDVLARVEIARLAFAYLDMDHYEPTVAALPWVWERLSIGGIILCDDYFGNRDWLASPAIDEWMAENYDSIVVHEQSNHQVTIRRVK